LIDIVTSGVDPDTLVTGRTGGGESGVCDSSIALCLCSDGFRLLVHRWQADGLCTGNVDSLGIGTRLVGKINLSVWTDPPGSVSIRLQQPFPSGVLKSIIVSLPMAYPPQAGFQSGL
jgi:hypothetical protein